MAITTVPPLWIPHPVGDATPSLGNMLIDAASEKAALVGQAPKTGNVRKVRFHTNTVTTGATVDVRVETVDLTTGDPSGTLFGTNTNGSQVILATDDNTDFLTALTADASVTKGDLLAVVIANPGASFGNMNIASVPNIAGLGNKFPYGDLFTGSWTKQAGVMSVALEYSDGTYAYMPGVSPWTSASNTAFNSGSTPDERALKFKLAVPFRVTGWWWFGRPQAAGADFSVKLYDSDGTTVLATSARDGDVVQNTTSAALIYGTFPSTYVLTKDTFYRISVLPTTANNLSVSETTLPAAAVLDAMDGGQNFHQSSRTDAGAWTDDTTKVPMIGLILDGMDDGVQTGGAAQAHGFRFF